MWQQLEGIGSAAIKECVLAEVAVRQAFPADPADIVKHGIQVSFEQLNTAGEIISAASLQERYIALRGRFLADAGWITGRPFLPVTGKLYEVSFGLVGFQGKTGHWTARIHAGGLSPELWTDLDTDLPVDPDLAQFVVQAFRAI